MSGKLTIILRRVDDNLNESVLSPFMIFDSLPERHALAERLFSEGWDHRFILKDHPVVCLHEQCGMQERGPPKIYHSWNQFLASESPKIDNTVHGQIRVFFGTRATLERFLERERCPEALTDDTAKCSVNDVGNLDDQKNHVDNDIQDEPAYLLRIQMPPSATGLGYLKQRILLFHKGTLPDSLGIKLAAFEHLTQNAVNGKWRKTPEDEADFVENHQVKVGILTYDEWRSRQLNGKAPESGKRHIKANIHLEAVDAVTGEDAQPDSIPAQASEPGPVQAKTDVDERSPPVPFLEMFKNLNTKGDSPRAKVLRDTLKDLGLPATLDQPQPLAGTTQKLDKSSLPNVWSMSPEEHRWSHYATNRDTKQENPDPLVHIPPRYSGKDLNHEDRDYPLSSILSRTGSKQKVSPYLPLPLKAYCEPHRKDQVDASNGPFHTLTPGPYLSCPKLSVPYFRYHVRDHQQKPIGPDPWVFTPYAEENILRTILSRHLGEELSKTSTLMVVNRERTANISYGDFIKNPHGKDANLYMMAERDIQIQVTSPGQKVVSPHIAPAVPLASADPAQEAVPATENQPASSDEHKMPHHDVLPVRVGNASTLESKAAQGVSTESSHAEKGSTGTYGLRLEETLESRSATPDAETTSSNTASEIVPEDGKVSTSAADKQSSSRPVTRRLDSSSITTMKDLIGGPLERVTSRDYLDNLIGNTGNTTASIRLLRIMQAENVSPASSLGLKLLDLAKALQMDGELAPPKPVSVIGSTTDKKVENIENRLNEFADMLNHIAETVGVNLEHSSTAPSSPTITSSPDEEAETQSPTAALTMRLPSLSALSQLEAINQKVNDTIDAVTSPRAPNVPLSDLNRPELPGTRDLSELVKKAQQLDKDEDEFSQAALAGPPDIAQAQVSQPKEEEESADVDRHRSLPDDTQAPQDSHDRKEEIRDAELHEQREQGRPFTDPRLHSALHSPFHVDQSLNPFAVPPQFGYSYRSLNSALPQTRDPSQNQHTQGMNVPFPPMPMDGHSACVPPMSGWNGPPFGSSCWIGGATGGGFSRYSQNNPYNEVQYDNSAFTHTHHPSWTQPQPQPQSQPMNSGFRRFAGDQARPAGGIFGDWPVRNMFDTSFFPQSQAQGQGQGQDDLMWGGFRGVSRWPIDRQ
ncbi:uncharacterized protein I303_105195 [Kwoniella dejecticola CBS 10117]|uniref:Uncharacterized protein n=1 Tax=Kwoniella dejecticola CBS 10117 TaxID=1296121 RepID=A0A1A6A370_9TREE|nr:uncharacterized protein I303_05358 [Kwoniella dejecticola CBS 10117]OBR84500.1 hypothetical protein I303_05358 [Kwoniella dejecticola CBS 10117]